MKWRLQFITLILIMGSLSFTGIYFAEKGIHKVEGISDDLTRSFQLVANGDGEMAMTVLGNEYSLQENKQLNRLLKHKERNSWGNEIGEWVTTSSRRVLNWITNYEEPS